MRSNAERALDASLVAELAGPDGTGRTAIPSARRGRSLVISNDERVADAVRTVAERLTVLVRVRSHVEALAVLPQNASWAGVVLDLDETAADALYIAKRVREANVLTPILGLASTESHKLINGLHALRVEPLIKPIAATNLRCFFTRALVSGWLPDARIVAWLDAQAEARRLTDREIQLIAYAIGRESRQQVRRRLGITENTLKTQIRRLLQKFQARTMESLAVRALTEALIFETPNSCVHESEVVLRDAARDRSREAS